MKYVSPKHPFVLCLLIATAGLSGCASYGPVPDVRLDGGQLQPAEQIARLAFYSSRSYPNRPLNTWWWFNVLSVDGKPISQNARVVQLNPGKHTIEYSCDLKFRFNDTGGAKGKGASTVTFEAGKTYYGYVKGQMSGYQDFGAAGIESQGNCSIEKFSTQNPYSLM